MEKVKTLWLTVVQNRVARRAAGWLLAGLLGVAVEQVARLGVLPPELVQALRAALSASSL